MQIDKMASIYKGATTSLVLDAELLAATMLTEAISDETPHGMHRQSLLRRGAPSGERMVSSKPQRRLNLESRARLACSVWMSRSWCLQEGELPPTIAVQFKNDAAILGRLSPEDGLYTERFPSEHLVAGDTASIASQPLLVDVGLDLPTNTSRLSEPWLHPLCQCVDIRLQRSFYETFFNESNTLASAWNELVGRSTTMSEDVPIIMSNIMELDNRELLGYEDTGQMFAALFLSLESLPMSVFFNQGPRFEDEDEDEVNLNRWLPVGIGNSLLSAQNGLLMRSTHLIYPHFKENSGFVQSTFRVDGNVRMKAGIYLYHESSGQGFMVKANHDITAPWWLHSGGSTIIMIEDTTTVSADLQVVRRAACFYCSPRELSRDAWFEDYWLAQIRDSGSVYQRTSMHFDSSLELIPCNKPRTSEIAPSQIYSMALIEGDHEFRIVYGTQERILLLQSYRS